MADTAQRAGIDIPITISNIDGLEKVHNQVNNLLSQVPKLKESFGGLNLKLDLGNKAETQITELNRKLGTTNELLGKVNSDVKNVSSKFSNASDTASNFGNKVKEASGDTKKLSESSSQNNEQFKKAISIISEMSGDIKKVVDYQKQQTSAVRETNTSLKDVASLSEKIYNGQGRQTDAIRTTNTQLGQTRLAINEIKNNQNEFTNAVSKSSNQANKLKDDFSKVNEKANMKPTLEKNTEAVKGLNTAGEETHKKFSGVKDVFTGTFAGTMIANGIMNITNGLGEQAKAGYEDAKAAETFQDKFKNMGASAKEIDILGASIKQIKENSNLSGGAVTSLTQKFYGMTGSAQKTQELTKGVGSLADALHLSGAQSDAFAGGLSRIEGSGKVTAMSLGRLEKQAPGLSSAMAKASGMSQKSFNDLVNSGKMTSSQFNDMLSKAGSHFDTNAKKFNSTTDGATHHMQTAWADTRKALMKPLVQVSSTGLGELNKVLDSKETQNAATQLGTAIGHVANATAKLVKVVSGSVGNVLSIIGSLTKIIGLLASGVWDTFSSVGKIIADVFESIFGKSKKAFDPLKLIADALKEVSKHENAVKAVGAAIGGIVTPILAVKGAMLAWKKSVELVQGAQKALNIVMNLNPIGLIVLAVAGITAGLIELYKHCKPFRDFVNKIAKEVGNFFGDLGKMIGQASKTVGNFFGGIGKWWDKNQKDQKKANDAAAKQQQQSIKQMKKDWDNLGKGIGNMWNDTKKNTGKIWDGFKKDSSKVGKDIGNGFKDAPKTAQSYMNKLQSGIDKTVVQLRKNTPKQFQNMWTDANNITRDRTKVNADLTKTGADLIHGHWSKLGQDLRKTSNDMWKWIKDIFKSSYDFLNDLTGGWLGKIVNFFVSSFRNIINFLKSSWEIIKNVWKSATDWIGDLWHGFTDTLKSVWDHTFGAIIDRVKSAIDSIHHSMVDIARGVIRPVNDMLKGLKDGINWVLDKVGADKISAKWEIAMPSYAKGTNDTHPGGLAKVNDGNGANFREMFQLPTGQIGMFPNKRNLIVNLPKGTSVLDGERSAQLSKRLGMPSYASGIGKFFNNAVKSVTGTFGKLWDKGTEIFDMVDDILKKPAEFMESVFAKFLGGTKSNISLASDIITHFPSTVAKAGIKWIKGLIDDFGGDAGGTRGDPSGSGVQRWRDTVKRALKANGIEPTDAMVNKWLRQIATESGGNAHAVQGNIGDINNATGDLAKGLVQVIGSTFRANAFPGHTNIFNGYDNLLAGIHYAIKRYGRGMGAIGNGHGYENGGFITKDQIARIGEGNKLEAVVPLTKRNRAFEIISQIFGIMRPSDKEKQQISGDGDSDNRNHTSQFDDDFFSPSHKTDNSYSVSKNRSDELNELKKSNALNEKMLAVLIQLSGLSAEQIKAIKDSKTDINDINKEQGKSFSLNDYQNLLKGV